MLADTMRSRTWEFSILHDKMKQIETERDRLYDEYEQMLATVKLKTGSLSQHVTEHAQKLQDEIQAEEARTRQNQQQQSHQQQQQQHDDIKESNIPSSSQQPLSSSQLDSTIPPHTTHSPTSLPMMDNIMTRQPLTISSSLYEHDLISPHITLQAHAHDVITPIYPSYEQPITQPSQPHESTTQAPYDPMKSLISQDPVTYSDPYHVVHPSSHDLSHITASFSSHDPHPILQQPVTSAPTSTLVTDTQQDHDEEGIFYVSESELFQTAEALNPTIAPTTRYGHVDIDIDIYRR